MATRYNSYDSRSSTTSSNFSDPSASTELKQPSLKNKPSSSSSRALVKSKPFDLSRTKTNKINNPGNLTTMVKKFMEMKSNSSSSQKRVELVIPSDVIAGDLKKAARNKGGDFSALQRKLFGKGRSAEKEKKDVKALTEVKGNTRTLAMVLRSERELLILNKDQEVEISELKLLLEDKSREVEKLKDLCLKQKEEIKALKSAVLFPDVMNSQLQEVLEKQGSELKQARQVIPTLQRQVTSLTGQLKCLAEDLTEVKADNYSARAYFQRHGSSPRTPTYEYDHEEATNSLEFSSGNPTTPGSPDDMFLKDLNPCLTPYYSNKKSKEFETLDCDSPQENLYENMQMIDGLSVNFSTKLSKSSNCCQSSKMGNTMAREARRSDETKGLYGKQMHHKLF